MQGDKRKATQGVSVEADELAPSTEDSSSVTALTIGSEEPPHKRMSLADLDAFTQSRESVESIADSAQSWASQSAVKTGSRRSSICGDDEKESLGEAPNSPGANVGNRYLKIYEYFLQANPEVGDITYPQDECHDEGLLLTKPGRSCIRRARWPLLMLMTAFIYSTM